MPRRTGGKSARHRPMPDRYFIENPVSATRASLLGSEARHLVRVMRVRIGDQVALFDGTGVEYLAEVVEIRRDEVELDIVDRAEIDRELSFHLTLAVALPKGDRQRWLVEKMVELGATRLLPLEATRSVARPSDAAVRRMKQWVIDASKQCGRNRLMEIAEPKSWPELVMNSASVPTRIVAHPQGEASLPESIPDANRREVLAAVGPEGGFTDDEIAAARDAAWQVTALGPRILRVETAAVYLAVGLATHFHEVP